MKCTNFDLQYKHIAQKQYRGYYFYKLLKIRLFAESHPTFFNALTSKQDTLLNMLLLGEKTGSSATNCTKVTEKFLIIS